MSQPDHNSHSQPGYPSETEQLKLANHYLRVALDQTQEGVIMLDTSPLDGSGPRVLYSNVPIACMTGVEPSKGLRGLHLCDLVQSPRDAVALLGALKDAAESGAAECTASLQTFYRTGAKPCLWRIKALHNNMKRLLNFTITIRELPTAATEPSRQQSPTAEDLDAVSDRLRIEHLAILAQGMAHDVNNLIVPITAEVSLLLPSMDPHSQLGQTLNHVLAAAHRAKAYTAQIVRMAKARPSEHKPTDLREIIRDTVTISKAGSSVDIRLHLADDMHPAHCDAVKVAQVLQNLVLNAIQAMPRGGFMDVETRNLQVALGQDSKLRPGPYLEISVRDRGTGISPENLKRLFKESFTTKKDGNGIGLTTCKLFIEQHGGDIRVTSTENVGTEFKLYLPAVPAEPGAGREVSKPTPTKPSLIAGQGNILVVDDDVAIRRVAASILRCCGYHVFECDRGELAVSTYLQSYRAGRSFDAVIMDLTLCGGMEGLEAAREIWAVDPSARIIVSSGSVTDEVQKTFVDQGCFAILPKPYEAGDLSDVVHRATTTPRHSLV